MEDEKEVAKDPEPPKRDGVMPMDRATGLPSATLRLAKDPRAEKVDGEQPYMQPPTVDGVVNVGMDHTIYLPSLEAQQSGFTPFMLDEENKPVDATRELLRQFGGIYKRVV